MIGFGFVVSDATGFLKFYLHVMEINTSNMSDCFFSRNILGYTL